MTKGKAIKSFAKYLEENDIEYFTKVIMNMEFLFILLYVMRKILLTSLLR